MGYSLKEGARETTVEEKLMPQKTIEKILRDVDIEKVAKLSETLRGIPAALESIRKTTAEHVGYEKSIDLPKLDKLAREMAEFARGALVARDPTLAAPAPEGGPGRGGGGGGAVRRRAFGLRLPRRRRCGARLGAGLFRGVRADEPGLAPDPPGARDAGQEPL